MLLGRAQFSSAPERDDPKARYYEGIFEGERKAITREEATLWNSWYLVPQDK